MLLFCTVLPIFCVCECVFVGWGGGESIWYKIGKIHKNTNHISVRELLKRKASRSSNIFWKFQNNFVCFFPGEFIFSHTTIVWGLLQMNLHELVVVMFMVVVTGCVHGHGCGHWLWSWSWLWSLVVSWHCQSLLSGKDPNFSLSEWVCWHQDDVCLRPAYFSVLNKTYSNSLMKDVFSSWWPFGAELDFLIDTFDLYQLNPYKNVHTKISELFLYW